LCRLLYMLTRRKDVTNLRAKKITRLSRDMIDSGQDASPVLMLCDLYVQYAPEIACSMPAKFSRPRSTFFRNPDPAWKAEIEGVERQVMKKLSQRTPLQERKNVSFLGKRQHNADSVPEAVSKKARLDQVNVSELTSTTELGKSLVDGKVVFPDRCTSILRDSMFQYLICLEPREDQILRLRHALPYLIEEEFYSLKVGALGANTEQSDKSVALRLEQFRKQDKLLCAMADFCDFMQQTLPELEYFIFRFLSTWDGVHHVDHILRLIARLQPRSFKSLYTQVLQPLYRLFQGGPIQLKLSIVRCLRRLLGNWAEIDWDSHLENPLGFEFNRSDEKDATFDKRERQVKRFVPILGGVDYYKVIFELIGFVDQTLLCGLIVEEDHPLLQLAAGDFYSLVAVLHTKHKLPFVAPPSPGLTYRMLLSSTAVGPSTMASVMKLLLNGFRDLKTKIENQFQEGLDVAPRTTFSNGLDKIEMYNSFIWDYCNALWRDQPIPQPSTEHRTTSLLFKHAEEVGLLDELRGLSPGDTSRAFNLTHSSAFIGLASDFVEACDNPAVNSINDITAEVKESYLDFLKRKNCDGLVEFLCSVISSLNRKRQQTNNV